MSKAEEQLKNLQNENTILKAQVYDLNVALQNMQSNTQGMLHQIVKVLDIDVPEEGIAFEEIITHIQMLASPETVAHSKE